MSSEHCFKSCVQINRTGLERLSRRPCLWEKTTRVKARVKAQALKEFMSTKERVVVMGHKITDVDALGAAIGIYRAGKTLGKPVDMQSEHLMQRIWKW